MSSLSVPSSVPLPSIATLIGLAGAQSRLATAFAGHAEVGQIATEFAALNTALSDLQARFNWNLVHRTGAVPEDVALSLIQSGQGQPV